jgi:hypothetical protein
MEKYRKNAALIQVFYEELNQESLSESPAYTWMSLLAVRNSFLSRKKYFFKMPIFQKSTAPSLRESWGQLVCSGSRKCMKI